MKKIILSLVLLLILSCSNNEEEFQSEINNELKILFYEPIQIGTTHIVLKGELEDYENFSVNEVGFCWSTNANPTIINDTIKATLTNAKFGLTINKLSENTTYYIKAYAQIDNDFDYSPELEFSTRSIDIINEQSYRFNSYYTENAISASKTKDGGFVVAGHIVPFYGSTDADLLLLKYDADLNLIWTKILSDEQTNQFANDIIEDSKGNLVVTSTLSYTDGQTYGSYATLTKFDFMGNTIWERIIQETGVYDGESWNGISLIQTSDGNYTIAGNWNPNHSSSESPDSNFSLIKYSSSGDLLFKKYYSNPGSIEHAWTLLENINGEIILIGTTPGQNNDSNMKCLKVSPDGLPIWEKEYGGLKGDFPRSAILTRDGHIVIAGSSNSFDNNQRVWLTKINWEGDVLWENSIGKKDAKKYLWGSSAIVEDKDSNLLIAAESSPLVPNTQDFYAYSDMYTIKTSPEGNLIWDKILNSTETIKSFDNGKSIIALTNGEIIIIGDKEDEEHPRFDSGTSDIWVVKIIEN